MAIFMTGATGFLGRRLLQGLLASGHDLALLVRGSGGEAAAARVRDSLASLEGADGRDLERRVRVCVGSLDQPGLGLSPADREHILSACDEFVHCGASVRLDLPLEEARRINVGGTMAVLELARERWRRGGLRRVDYVSTAFVAGNRTDLVPEGALEGRYGHKNTYEQTKFEAEAAARELCDGLPLTVYRPSIIVGDSETGWTSSFKMIYWPAKIYALGLWRTVPGNPGTPLDLVPVNFVSDAILEIRRRPESLARCFHIAAGPRGSTTLGELSRIVMDLFPNRKPVRFVNPDWWLRYVQPVLSRVRAGAAGQILRTGVFYIPYFSRNPQFDNSGAVELLAGSTVTVPEVRDYVERLFRYCVQTDWGRKAVSN